MHQTCVLDRRGGEGIIKICVKQHVPVFVIGWVATLVKHSNYNLCLWIISAASFRYLGAGD